MTEREIHEMFDWAGFLLALSVLLGVICYLAVTAEPRPAVVREYPVCEGGER